MKKFAILAMTTLLMACGSPDNPVHVADDTTADDSAHAVDDAMADDTVYAASETTESVAAPDSAPVTDPRQDEVPVTFTISKLCDQTNLVYYSDNHRGNAIFVVPDSPQCRE
jgi:hypothetical protein